MNNCSPGSNVVVGGGSSEAASVTVSLVNDALDGYLNIADVAAAQAVASVSTTDTGTQTYAIVESSTTCDATVSYDKTSIPTGSDTGFTDGTTYKICVHLAGSNGVSVYAESGALVIDTTAPAITEAEFANEAFDYALSTADKTANNSLVSITGTGIVGDNFAIVAAGTTCDASVTYNKTDATAGDSDLVDGNFYDVCVRVVDVAGNYTYSKVGDSFTELAVNGSYCADVCRISLDSDENEVNGTSASMHLNSDGRYVVFESIATNLVSGDTNGVADIFVRDNRLGTTRRVSVATDGTEADAASSLSRISGSGRYVVFQSTATNLVSGDTNGANDVFLHDLKTSTTTLMSKSTDGTFGNAGSDWISISRDGKFVSFHSTATNLVSGDTNGVSDVFVHEISTGTTTRASVDSVGTEGNGASSSSRISQNGRYVAFVTAATNLYTGDTNGQNDVVIYDRTTGTTTNAHKHTDGTLATGAGSNPKISDDGLKVAFLSFARNIVTGDGTAGFPQIFHHNTQTGVTIRVSQMSDGTDPTTGSNFTDISGDGNYVPFDSMSTNIIAGDTNGTWDTFLLDIANNTNSRSSLATGSAQLTGASNQASMSADNRYLGFHSADTGVVAGDTNGATDVFIRASGI